MGNCRAKSSQDGILQLVCFQRISRVFNSRWGDDSMEMAGLSQGWWFSATCQRAWAFALASTSKNKKRVPHPSRTLRRVGDANVCISSLEKDSFLISVVKRHWVPHPSRTLRRVGVHAAEAPSTLGSPCHPERGLVFAPQAQKPTAVEGSLPVTSYPQRIP